MARANQIQAADLAGRRSGIIKGTDVERADSLLRLASARVVSLPEPVVVPPMVNGRPLKSWERGLYRQAMQRERRAELELFDGLIS